MDVDCLSLTLTRVLFYLSSFSLLSLSLSFSLSVDRKLNYRIEIFRKLSATFFPIIAVGGIGNEIRCHKFNCYNIIEFPDLSIQNTADTNADDAKLQAIGTVITSTLSNNDF